MHLFHGDKSFSCPIVPNNFTKHCLLSEHCLMGWVSLLSPGYGSLMISITPHCLSLSSTPSSSFGSPPMSWPSSLAFTRHSLFSSHLNSHHLHLIKAISCPICILISRNILLFGFGFSPSRQDATSIDLFEYLLMPFGLRNAAQTVHYFIVTVLHVLDFVCAYMDNLCSASHPLEEHYQPLEIVFRPPNKYAWWSTIKMPIRSGWDQLLEPSNHEWSYSPSEEQKRLHQRIPAPTLRRELSSVWQC